MSNAEEKGKCRKCEIDGRMKGGVESDKDEWSTEISVPLYASCI